MKTYCMGRFAIDVPVEMKQKVQAHKIRHAEIEQFQWAQGALREKERISQWTHRIDEIKNLPKPENVADIIIEERLLPGLGEWAKVWRLHHSQTAFLGSLGRLWQDWTMA